MMTLSELPGAMTAGSADGQRQSAKMAAEKRNIGAFLLEIDILVTRELWRRHVNRQS